ncbi:MAG: discoidin domain-containing protein, partial [Planctomycetota bacterium]
ERFAIGVWLDPGYDLWVDGAIDEVRYYGRALAQDEIVAVMSSSAVLSSEPSPADKADDVPRDVSLTWTGGVYAATHDVYFGTVFDDVSAATRADALGVLVSQGQAGTVYDPAGRLDFGQTYYWRVDEVNAPPDSAVYAGTVWSFTTEPLAYPIQSVTATSNGSSEEGAGPENTINGSGLNADDQHSVASDDMWLAVPGDDPLWIQYEFDRLYKLHELAVWNYNVQFEPMLGFGFKDVSVAYSANGADWTVLGDVEFAQATAQSTYTPNTTIGFEGAAAKYVRLTANSGWGITGQRGLSEVRFTFIPAHARQPQPASGADDVSVDAILSWRAGREAAAHEVYFGTDPEGLAPAGTTTENRYAPASLEFGSRYYWRVDEVNGAEGISVWEGDIWTFATQEYAAIDDFESYIDEMESGQAIFDTWIDGWVNQTGSTVGYLEAPFTERTIVHGGRQSMPLMYDNTTSPWYSEAARTFDGLQDWTGHGAETLALFIHGQADNATEMLYVAVEDSAGHVAAVTHPNSAAVLTTAEWQSWAIGLDEFRVDGVQVDRVRTLYIGLGDRDNPIAGGTGVVYIDDIQFGRSAADE